MNAISTEINTYKRGSIRVETANRLGGTIGVRGACLHILASTVAYNEPAVHFTEDQAAETVRAIAEVFGWGDTIPAPKPKPAERFEVGKTYKPLDDRVGGRGFVVVAQSARHGDRVVVEWIATGEAETRGQDIAYRYTEVA